ncbi:N(2), N(2)-dimethylguanosine tRNA methyltransferase, putative [Bodo saltans]|uniref:tRNA (guanine(26)-N(2))-dimethyltransferase n=1 Tax=Bodo saltans TaxID=75058 RepID=A0A0S4IT52_BODSA|nr:N(2), N(2)-dimethylguanosine tRNA methyltransferase, putative [Bodo saltans]|eukprot:CUF00217.1 N(2), N(2)-dimethylguanosine tRNA methyltransferase, putative [Bodo saltans]
MSGRFSLAGLDDEAPIPQGFEKVVEGFAAVLFPPAAVKKAASAPKVQDEEAGVDGDDQSIFYNPAQVVNRDLSICAIEAFSRLRVTEHPRKGGTGTNGITILEALSATGLRALRYWKEITGVKYIIANDLDKDAVQCIARNCAFNDAPIVQPTLTQNITDEDVLSGGGVICNHDDAIHLMQRLAMVGGPHSPGRMALIPPTTDPATPPSPQPLLQQELIDVVDLDPYGTASPFLDSAFSCIKEGGLMLVTSTDSPILCGNYPDTCHAKYNSLMMKPDACHEVAVRILLAAAERAANKHKKYIVPLISLHIDFYIRVFFRVYTQAAETKLATAKLAHVAHCTRCPAFWVTPIGRVRLSRKEFKKRRRNGEATGDEAVAEESTNDAETATNKRTDIEPPTVYPATPNRAEPFKVSCPTIETWLPSGTDNHCPCCGGHISIGGPIYAAPTQNTEFLEKLLAVVDERAADDKITATDRVRGLILAAKDELQEAPLFYSLPEMSSFVKVRCPPTPIIVGALTRLGYKFSQVHCHRSGIKTTCPPTMLMRALLAYKETDEGREEPQGGNVASTSDAAESTVVAVDPAEAQRKLERAAKKKEAQEQQAHCILTPLAGLDFSYDRKYDFRSQATGISKFIPNAPGWGPKRRHQGVAE